jgi:hypothetical protein
MDIRARSASTAILSCRRYSRERRAFRHQFDCLCRVIAKSHARLLLRSAIARHYDLLVGAVTIWPESAVS